MLVEHVHPGPHREVEHHRPVLDEHAAVAAAAQHHVGAVGRDEPAEHAVVAVARRRDHQGRRRPPRRRSSAATAPGRRAPARTAPRRPAPSGPASSGRRRHRHRADEPAEARPVGPEQDRGVTGEVQRTDAIRVVVDVRRVQSRLAAVGARPLRLRAHQPHAGAIGVEMHRVVGGEERVDVGAGEELRRRVRPHGHRELPAVPDAGCSSIAAAAAGVGGPGSAPWPRVAGAQRPALVAADGQGEGGRAAQILARATAGDHRVSRIPAGQHRDLEHTPGGDGHRLPLRERTPPGHGDRCAGGRTPGLRPECERGAARVPRVRARPRGFRHTVRVPERQVVHRSRRRNAHLPVADPAGPVLHRGQHPGVDDLDRAIEVSDPHPLGSPRSPYARAWGRTRCMGC